MCFRPSIAGGSSLLGYGPIIDVTSIPGPRTWFDPFSRCRPPQTKSVRTPLWVSLFVESGGKKDALAHAGDGLGGLGHGATPAERLYPQSVEVGLPTAQIWPPTCVELFESCYTYPPASLSGPTILRPHLDPSISVVHSCPPKSVSFATVPAGVWMLKARFPGQFDVLMIEHSPCF